MDGFNGVSNLYNHLAMYWLAFGLLLTLLSFKIWNRGIIADFSVKVKQFLTNWNKVQKLSATFLFLIFILNAFLARIFHWVTPAKQYLIFKTIQRRLEP